MKHADKNKKQLALPLLTEGPVRGQVKGSIDPNYTGAQRHLKPIAPPPAPQPSRVIDEAREATKAALAMRQEMFGVIPRTELEKALGKSKYFSKKIATGEITITLNGRTINPKGGKNND